MKVYQLQLGIKMNIGIPKVGTIQVTSLKCYDTEEEC